MSSAQQSNEEVIFNTARKIDSVEAREEYLTQVCAGDAALRERVEQLLKSQADESQFLEAPALAPTCDSAPVHEQPGTQIGRYKLLQEIGEGGFGVVYMAEQEKPVRRKVALKIIKAGMDTREVVARFEAERQALALMEHPNIAKVLDGGSTEKGRPYFVMELVKGVPLTKFCDENKLDTSQRLELFQSVCKAIQHAHQKGIIHRDIKPSNVMVTLHDGEPVVKVIDFGVSKAISQRLTEKTMFTAYGQMIGTPQYMSPEQAEMSGLDIDTRSDIYSLGVLLYELLTGSTPIQPERLRQTGYAEMQRLIREDEPPRPSMRLSTQGEQTAKVAIARNSDAKKLGDLLRGELDWIVMKAIEKNRDRRYETANGLAKDVQRYLEGEPVSACPPSIAYQFKKFANKHRGILVSVGSVLSVLALATILSTLFAIDADQAKREANRNLDELREEQRKNVIANENLVNARGQEALDNAIDQLLRGNVEASRSSLEVARTNNADPGEVALCEAALVYYSGSHEYLEPLNVALEHLPDSMAAKVLLANAYMLGPSQNTKKFVELDRQLIRMEPISTIDLLLAGQYFAMKKTDRAINYLYKLKATHNSRLAYYELSRVYTEKVKETYSDANIEEFLKYSGVAFQTMPDNELASRRYVWANLVAADHYGLGGKSELEQHYLAKAETAAKNFLNHQQQSSRAHQSVVSVYAYKGEWDKAITHAQRANKFLKQGDGYANSVALMIRQGIAPSLDEFVEHRPGGDLWRTMTVLHSQGPQAARESLMKWESNNDRPLFHFEIAMLFEINCLLGQPEKAVQTADRHIDRSPPSPFYQEFMNRHLKFMAARLSEEEVLHADKRRITRIWHYAAVGFKRLGEGKRAEAILAFEQIEKEGKVNWGIYEMGFPCRSLAYLHRLREDPTWPSWIPEAESE